MTQSYHEVVASGNVNVFPVPFSYLDKTHVKVFVDDVEVSASSLVWTSNNTIQLPLAASAYTGKRIRLQRVTPDSGSLVEFRSGGLRPHDLNIANAQTLNLVQELRDESSKSLKADYSGGAYDAKGRRIANVGAPTATKDAATKEYVDSTSLQLLGSVWDGEFRRLTRVAEPASDYDAATKKFSTDFTKDYVAEYVTARGSIPNENWGTVAVNVLSYSHLVVGGDWGPAIQAAIDLVAAAGGGIVFIPSGVYPIATTIRPGSNITLRGAGAGCTKLKVPNGVPTQNRIIFHIDPAVTYQNVIIEHLGFEGQWVNFKSEVSDNGMVTLKWVTNLKIRDCIFRNSRNMVLNINECDHVTVEGNLFEYACRDFVGVWGTPNVRVMGNTMRHNDDDGISINYETIGKDPVRSRIIIAHNFLEDCGPIRTQVPKNVLITGNVLDRTRGVGINLWVANVSGNATSSANGIIVENNIITNVMERVWNLTGDQVGNSNSRIYILVNSIKPQAGSLPVPPGEINPSTGRVESPYGWNFTRADTNPASGSIRAPHGVIIRGNICMRTLSAVAKYSDWGHGPGYSKGGMVDYPVSEEIMRAPGCRVQLPYADLLIEGNHFECGRHGVYFDLATGVTLADRLAKGIIVRGNRFKDFDRYGIGWVGGSSPTTHQGILIEGNTFNGDPYFSHFNRLLVDGKPSGAWQAGNGGADYPVAIRIDGIGGVRVKRNEFRNVASCIAQAGVSALTEPEGNEVVADPATTGFSTLNKGVGNIPGIGGGEQFWLSPEDCDPTSLTYGHSYGATTRNAGGMPGSGKWLAGMQVRNRGTGANQDGKVVLEWRRLTTGTGHVAGTDWRPVHGTVS